MKGIKNDLCTFSDHGICPSQIVVVVICGYLKTFFLLLLLGINIFDGIEKINNDQSDRDNNMIRYFDELDMKYNIDKKKTLKHNYKNIHGTPREFKVKRLRDEE